MKLFKKCFLCCKIYRKQIPGNYNIIDIIYAHYTFISGLIIT